MNSAAARLTPTKFRAELPMTGETFEFVSSARTAADGRFRFVWTLAAGKRGPSEHVHPDETETFAVVSGVLRIWLDGVAKDYRAGDVVPVGPNTRHRFFNPGSEPAVVNVSLDGARMEDLLVPIIIACDGKKPRLRDMARMFMGISRKGPSVPTSRLERTVILALVGVLRLFGVKRFEPVYGWDQASG